MSLKELTRGGNLEGSKTLPFVQLDKVDSSATNKNAKKTMQSINPKRQDAVEAMDHENELALSANDISFDISREVPSRDIKQADPQDEEHHRLKLADYKRNKYQSSNYQSNESVLSYGVKGFRSQADTSKQFDIDQISDDENDKRKFL